MLEVVIVVRGAMRDWSAILEGWDRGEVGSFEGSDREGRVARWREIVRRREALSTRRIIGFLGSSGWMYANIGGIVNGALRGIFVEPIFGVEVRETNVDVKGVLLGEVKVLVWVLLMLPTSMSSSMLSL